MKKLLFSSFLAVLLISFIYCASNKNTSTIQKSTEEMNDKSPKKEAIISNEVKVQQGDLAPVQSSDTNNTQRGNYYKKTEIKHGAPNQSEIDLIKKEKTKKKKQTQPPD